MTTSFDVVGAPAWIVFNSAEDGAVEGITFHQDGAQHPGKRVVETAAAVALARQLLGDVARELGRLPP